MTKVKCDACETESDPKNFCGDCGNVLAKADVEYEATLKEIAGLAKAAVDDPEPAPAPEPEPEPEVEAEADADADAELSLVQSLLRGQEAILEKIQNLVAEITDVKTGNMALAKATHLLMLKAAVPPVQVTQRAGARSQLRAVEVIEKAPAIDAEPEVRGHALMAKCLVAKDAGRLNSSDIGAVNFWTNRNASLSDLAKVDEDLASRVASAIS